MTQTEHDATGRAPWAAPRDGLAVVVWTLAALLGLVLVVVAFLAVLQLGLPADPGYTDPADRESSVRDLERAREVAAVALLVCVAAIVLLVLGVLTWSHRRRRRLVFAPPPGWPEMPAGWRPYRGWQPSSDWPPAPDGWRFWVDRRSVEQTGG